MQQPTPKDRCAILNTFYRLNKGAYFLKRGGVFHTSKGCNGTKRTSQKNDCSAKRRGIYSIRNTKMLCDISVKKVKRVKIKVMKKSVVL